jgi:hypothetical protein
VHITHRDWQRRCKSLSVFPVTRCDTNIQSHSLIKVTSSGYNLKVAFVLGDNLFEEMKEIREKGLPPHLDADNSEITMADHTFDLIEQVNKPIVSANAYLGAREIIRYAYP